MILHWIDPMASLAYIVVVGPVCRFCDFTNQVDALINEPRWSPGMPIVEDLTELEGGSPPEAETAWRQYVATRAPLIHGCHWAVVTPPDPKLWHVLNVAAEDASQYGVILRPFPDATSAHAWIASVARDR